MLKQDQEAVCQSYNNNIDVPMFGRIRNVVHFQIVTDLDTHYSFS